MQITEYKGKSLIDKTTLEEIEKQADLIVKNKNVAASYNSAEHLKKELSGLSQEEVRPVLDRYRRVTSKLKSLALPLLSQDEIGNLLENNLDFLDTLSIEYLKQGIVAYLASQPDEDKARIKNDLSKRVEKGSVFAPEILNIFSVTEDDNELLEAFGKADEINAQPSSEPQAEAIARQIFSQSDHTASEEDFTRRAKALINSRFRDVRTRVDLNGYLSRPFAAGGLGLFGQALDFADRIIEQEYQKANSFAYTKKTGFEPSSEYDEKKDSEFLFKNGQISADSTTKSQEDDTHSEIDKLIMSENASAYGIEQILKEKAPITIKEPQPQKESDASLDENLDSAALAQGSMMHQRRTQAQNGKVRLDDVKFHPDQNERVGGIKAFSLADEFSTITLSDYRSMGELASANKKLLSELNVLEEEAIENKVAGIKSFRQSPLYQRYLSIGEECLLKNKKLSEVLPDLSVNPERMTEEEFFAITDLNIRLK